jgi:hypothetical protein
LGTQQRGRTGKARQVASTLLRRQTICCRAVCCLMREVSL